VVNAEIVVERAGVALLIRSAGTVAEGTPFVATLPAEATCRPRPNLPAEPHRTARGGCLGRWRAAPDRARAGR